MQLGNLARLAAGSLRATTQTSADGAEAGGGRLELADFHGTASTAYSAVEVPDSVIDLLTTTRDYLQVSTRWQRIVRWPASGYLGGSYAGTATTSFAGGACALLLNLPLKPSIHRISASRPSMCLTGAS